MNDVMRAAGVVVRFHGPTNTRPSRYSATWHYGSDRIRKFTTADPFGAGRDDDVARWAAEDWLRHHNGKRAELDLPSVEIARLTMCAPTDDAWVVAIETREVGQ